MTARIRAAVIGDDREAQGTSATPQRPVGVARHFSLHYACGGDTAGEMVPAPLAGTQIFRISGDCLLPG